MDKQPKKGIFLDRDGVLNHAIVRDGKPYPPGNIAEMRIIEGVPEALAHFREKGFLLICVTNQPDVARGSQTKEKIEEINQYLCKILQLNEVITCYHDDRDNCRCRKPQPGMLLAAAEKYGINLTNSYMVGDRWRDIEAGRLAGCKTVFVDYGYAEKQPTPPPDFRVHSLLEAKNVIC